MFMNGALELKSSVRSRIQDQQAQLNADLVDAYDRLEKEQDHGLPTQATAALIDKLRVALAGTERLLAKPQPAY